MRDKLTTFARVAAVIVVTVGIVVGSWVYARGLLDAFQLPKRALLMTGGLVGAAVLMMVTGWGRGWTIPKEALLLVTFVAVAVIGAAGAEAPEQSSAPLRDVLALTGWWMIGVLLLRRDRDLRAVLTGLVVAGLVVGRLGILQSKGLLTCETIPEVRFFAEILGYPDNRPAWFENLPVSQDAPGSLAGHVNVAAEGVLLGFIAALGLLAVGIERIGRLRRALHRAALRLPVLANRQRLRRVRMAHGRAWLWLPPLTVAAVIQGQFLLLAGSRAAWLAGGVAVSWLAVGVIRRQTAFRFRPKVVAVAAGASGLVVLAALLLAPHIEVTGREGVGTVPLSERVLEAADWTRGTERERFILWGNTRAMVRSQPWLGVGAGNWKIEYPRWSKVFAAHSGDAFSPIRQPERAHNDPLQVLAETGVVGFLCLFGFIAWSAVRLARAGRGASRTQPRHVAMAVVGAVCVLSLVAFPFQIPVTGAVTFLLLGAGAGMTRGGGRFRVPRTGAVTLAVIFAILATLAAFDFNGRLKADESYWLARWDQRASAISADDRGAVGKLTGRDLLQRALDRLDQATARNPASYRYHMKRAEVLWELGLGDQAFAAFDRVLELHPNLVQAMLMKAELHDRLGRREDFAAAWHLIHVRARRIMPLSPEVHYAAGQHLMLMAERIPDHAEFYRGQAIAQFEFVSEAREYAPNARLALAAALLDRGDPLPKLMAVLALAERDASAAPAYLARCARLYGDPRLGAHGGGMFGPAGQKTQALWQRVLELTRGGHADARMETMLAPWHQWRAGNSAGTRPELGEVLTWFESRVRTDPQAVLPRYYLALILEDMDRMGEAQIQWANLVRYVGRGGRLSTFWKGKILFEAGEFSRRLEQARGSTPTGGK